MTLKTKPLSEQVAVVTGGGTGIGRAFTEALALDRESFWKTSAFMRDSC